MSKDLRKFLTEQITTNGLIKRVIINYKRFTKPSITLQKTKGCLSNLKIFWKKTQLVHSMVSITLAVTAEDRKKLSYFLQDEFLAAEDAYNEAMNQLQDTMNNFVKPDRFRKNRIYMRR
jgi:hypothetical protein